MSQGRCLCAPRSSRRPQWVFSLVPPAWPFCPLKRKCRLKGLAHVRTNSLIFAVTQQSWDILEFLKVSKKKKIQRKSKKVMETQQHGLACPTAHGVGVGWFLPFLIHSIQMIKTTCALLVSPLSYENFHLTPLPSQCPRPFAPRNQGRYWPTTLSPDERSMMRFFTGDTACGGQ